MLITTAHHHHHLSGTSRGPLFLLIFCVTLLLFQASLVRVTEAAAVAVESATPISSNSRNTSQLQSPPPHLRQQQLQSGLKLVETTIRIVDIFNENSTTNSAQKPSPDKVNSSSKAVQYATIERTEGRLPTSASRLFNLPAFNPLRDVTVRKGRQVIVSQAKAQQIARLLSELDTAGAPLEISSASPFTHRSRHHRSTTPGNEEGDEGGKKRKKVEKQETVRVNLGNGQSLLVTSTSTFSYDVTSEPEADKEEKKSNETGNATRANDTESPSVPLPKRIIKLISVPEVKEAAPPPEVTLDERDEYQLVPVKLNYRVSNGGNETSAVNVVTTVISKEKEDARKEDKENDDDDDDDDGPVSNKYKGLKLNPVKSSGPKQSSTTTTTAAPETSIGKTGDKNDDDIDDDDDDDDDGPVSNKYKGLKLNPVKSSGPKQSSSTTTTTASPETTTGRVDGDDDDDDDDDDDSYQPSADGISFQELETRLWLRRQQSSSSSTTTTAAPETSTEKTGDKNDDDDDDDDGPVSNKYKGLKLNPVKSSGPKQSSSTTTTTASPETTTGKVDGDDDDDDDDNSYQPSADGISFQELETRLWLRRQQSSSSSTTTESTAAKEDELVFITTETPITTTTTLPSKELADEPATTTAEDLTDRESQQSTTEVPSNTLEEAENPSDFLEESEPSITTTEEPSMTTVDLHETSIITTTSTTQTPLLESKTSTPKPIETTTTLSSESTTSSQIQPKQTDKSHITTTSPPSTTETSSIRTSTNFTQSRSIESTFHNPQLTTTTPSPPAKDTVQIRYRSTSLRPEDKNLFELLYTIFLLNRFEAHGKTPGKNGRPVKKIRIKIMEFAEEDGGGGEPSEMITQQKILEEPAVTTPISTNESMFYNERIEIGSPSISDVKESLNSDEDYPPPRPVEVKLRITGIINENRTKDGGATVRRTSVRIKPMEMSLRLNYSMRSNGLLNGNIELATLLSKPLDARLRVGETINNDETGYPLQKLDSRTARSDYPDGEEKDAEETNELPTRIKADKKADNEDEEAAVKKNKYAHLKLNKVKSSGPKQKAPDNSTGQTSTSNVKFYNVKKTEEVEHHVEEEKEEEDSKNQTTTTTESPTMTTTENIQTYEPTIATVPVEYLEQFTTTPIPPTTTEKANVTAELLQILDSLEENGKKESPSPSTTSTTTTTTSTTPVPISPSTSKSMTTKTTTSLPEPVFRQTVKAVNTEKTTTKSSPEPVFISSSTTTTTTTTQPPKLSLGSILKMQSNSINRTENTPVNSSKTPESGRSLDNTGNNNSPSQFQLNFLLALALIIVFCALGVGVFCFVKSISKADKNKGIEADNSSDDSSNGSNNGGEDSPPINVGRYSKVVSSSPFPYQQQQQKSSSKPSAKDFNGSSTSSFPSRHVKWLDIEKDVSVIDSDDERF